MFAIGGALALLGGVLIFVSATSPTGDVGSIVMGSAGMLGFGALTAGAVVVAFAVPMWPRGAQVRRSEPGARERAYAESANPFWSDLGVAAVAAVASVVTLRALDPGPPAPGAYLRWVAGVLWLVVACVLVRRVAHRRR